MANYVSALERAFSQLGSQQFERFRQSTDPPPVEVVKATLVRDAIPAGNPREW
jgi:hypothetical protein